MKVLKHFVEECIGIIPLGLLRHYRCHDLTMLSVNISNLAIITVKNVIIIVLFETLANVKELI